MRLVYLLLFISTQCFASSDPLVLEAKNIAGKNGEMGKRAMILYHLYDDSKENFPFALAISHLTLAVEQSITTHRLDNILNTFDPTSFKKQWRLWGISLKRLNKLMVRRLYFAYQYSKDPYPLNDPTALMYYNDTKELIPIFQEIHRANENQVGLSIEEKWGHTQKFIRWEHEKFFRPRLENLVKKFGLSLRLLLEHVPGPLAQRILGPFFQMRSTFKLPCLAQEFHTNNFLDTEERISQAENFYIAMAEIDFDPSVKCFESAPYIGRFPRTFFKNPKHFSSFYFDVISGKKTGWIYDQYKTLPVEEFAAIPPETLSFSDEDRKYLSLAQDPIVRNHYINQQYQNIAEKLRICLGDPQAANWYDFAKWASISGGEIISGKKFDHLSWLKKGMLKFGDYLAVAPKAKIIELFARTNALIAIQMVPIGKLFLQEFCEKNSAYSSLKNHFNDKSLHQSYLLEGLFQYYLARSELNPKIRLERIALGASLQVMAEQMRIDDNIDAVFRYEGESRLGDYLYRMMSTREGGLSFGKNLENKIFLHHSVPTATTAMALKKIDLPSYQLLFDSYNLPLSIENLRTYPRTATYDWSNLRSRFRFLLSFFRSFLTYGPIREQILMTD